jgi:prepilin-type N-terminal cleavage/methylation domain-containing protein
MGRKGGFTLIELLVVVAIIGILSSIAIPQYAKFRKGAQDAVAQQAYRSIALSQEAYFADNGRYVTDYGSLAASAGLVKDEAVCYGAITTYVNGTTGASGFRFAVMNKASGSDTFSFDSASVSSTVKRTSVRLEASVW